MFSTSNSRLASALCVLNFVCNRVSRDRETRICTFDFSDDEAAVYERHWLDFEAWSKENVDHPFTYMRRVSNARDWIVNRVLHGNHNLDMVLSGPTYSTSQFKVACLLVALDYYLIKLDDNRQFHFSPTAKRDAEKYFNSPNGSPERIMRQYLEMFDNLSACVKNAIDNPQPILQSRY